MVHYKVNKMTSLFLQFFGLFFLLYLNTVLGYLDTKIVCSVPYGDGYIKTWENKEAKGKYYAMPLAYLRKASARCVSDVITERYLLLFDVIMWNYDANEVVFRHVRKNINSEVKKIDISVLPMEKLRISWRNPKRPLLPSKFELQDHWRINRHSQHVMTFSISCATAHYCRRFKDMMNQYPLSVNNFELEFITNSSKAKRRTVVVHHSLIRECETARKVLESGASKSPASDTFAPLSLLENIAEEAVAKAVASDIPEADVIVAGDLKQIKRKVLQQLKHGGPSRAANWNMVSWIPGWKRPDIIANHLNKIFRNYEKDATKVGVHLKDSDGNADFKMLIDRYFGKKNENNISISDVKKVLEDEDLNVVWTGEKFEPKHIQIFKVQLTTKNVSSSIRFHIHDTVHNLKVRMVQPVQNATVTLSPELLESRLSDAISKQEELLNETVEDLKQLQDMANVTSVKVKDIEQLELIKSKLDTKDDKCRFEDSMVLKNHKTLHENLLNITKDVQNSHKCWKRCYVASENNYKSASFHHSCDGKGPTISLIRVNNKIFGGYTDRSWGNSNGHYYWSVNSFIFILQNPKNFKLWSKTQPQHAIYTNNGYGPTFGAHDIYVADSCKFNTASYGKSLGTSYELPHGYSKGGGNTKILLAGSQNFRCDEYEVYYQV